jgi:D-alanyl-D-alanine carboxypeptidase/D-alanyl-D-alanine-endopeptidase (penicillin-binding protein 4)
MKCKLFPILSLIIFFSSCSLSKQIGKSAKENVLHDDALQTAHVGISIYEPATGKFWYNYQGDKYFVPASNTKLPTCYAAMKYLGDSLVGLKYGMPEKAFKNIIVIQPTGDPTFLHEDYSRQRVFDFLKQKITTQGFTPAFMDTIWKDERWGNGWSWNDYEEPYMAERSSFPIFGNTITISLNSVKDRNVSDTDFWNRKRVKLFKTDVDYFDSVFNNSRLIQTVSRKVFTDSALRINIRRDISKNALDVEWGNRPFSKRTISFVTNESFTAREVLGKMLNKKFDFANPAFEKNRYYYQCEECELVSFQINKWNVIHSQPTDSLLKPMMHRSDNFFAEQSLLMVSNELLGLMNDEKIIDTLLKTDFKDLPQKPKWVDGSGLSRYNLFTPQDFVFILNKMKTNFGMDRIKTILPTGNEGTLGGRFVKDSNYIFAKTGTLSGVVSLSGFLYTKKNKLLIFSILVNNHNSSAGEIRRAVEKFIEGIREKF